MGIKVSELSHLSNRRGMDTQKELRQQLWCHYGKINVVLDNGKTTKSILGSLAENFS